VEKPIITNVVKPDSHLVPREDPTVPLGKRTQVQVARDGFDVTVVRRVHEEGNVGNDEGGPGKLRTLRLKSVYQRSRNVVLVGTLGKPAEMPSPVVPSPSPTTGAAEPNPTSPEAATPSPACPGTSTPGAEQP
jgi:hypothetical protein